ncbi:uncharacterized protein [Phyllobates terribilis]|uniref:uncharacterized protein n=1 Tax=Phyllobates terribilis TaxID=111132 RepID=UPI003CCAE230
MIVLKIIEPGKSTFQAVIKDLNLTGKEQLDLLVNWLRLESAERIKTVKAVYVDYSDAGLLAAWERLEQTYGSSEAIESALFKRLQTFPRITDKDNRKIQDLSNLLKEIELVKLDPRLSGLSYLDTAHGVNPVVLKLHHDFYRFVSDQARKKNDPSFDFTEPTPPASSSSTRYDNNITKRKELRSTVSMRKTDVPLTAPSFAKTNAVAPKARQ